MPVDSNTILNGIIMKDLKTQFGVAQETTYQHWNHFMTPIG
jgi:hypothetical protein